MKALRLAISLYELIRALEVSDDKDLAPGLKGIAFKFHIINMDALSNIEKLTQTPNFRIIPLRIKKNLPRTYSV